MNTGQILLNALKLYGKSFKKVFFLALSVATIAFIPRLIAFSTHSESLTQLPITNPHKLWLLLIDLLCLIYFSAILWRLNCVNTNAQESLLDDLQIGFKKVPHIVIAIVIQSVVSLLLSFTTYGVYSYMHGHNLLLTVNPYAFILVALPIVLQFYLTIYLIFLIIFYFPLIVVENKNAFSSLTKSARLVWGSWWKTFFAQISPWLIYLVVLLAIKYILRVNIHIYYLESTGEPLLAIYFHILIFAIFVPWVAATLLVQLRDLEGRIA